MSKIRELLPSEYDQLDDFLYEAVFTAPGEPRPPRDIVGEPGLRAYVEGFGSHAGDVAVCAEKDGELVGVAWARRMRGYAFVDDEVPELAVAVLPGWRGRGIGTALVRELVARCASVGAPALSLSVQRANPARRLYERLGFRELRGDGAEVVMVLPLTAPSRAAAARERAK